MSLFSGLREFGFDEDLDMDLYDEDLLKPRKKAKKKSSKRDTDYLLKKNIDCPCCGIDFEALVVRSGKITLKGHDEDLRPIYEELDPLKYDVLVCPICGYASMAKTFDTSTVTQRQKIINYITPWYTGASFEGYSYSYDTAILRYKMALLCDLISDSKSSQRAYTCLKLAWLMRGKLEYEYDYLDLSQRKHLEADELAFLKRAYDGFDIAYDTEKFPVCGMDEVTIMYLLAILAYRLQDYDNAVRFIYLILGNSNASQKVKDKILELKDKTKKKVKELQEQEESAV